MITNFQGKKGLDNDARFDSKFIISDGCWEWLGSSDKDGYGNFWDCEQKTNVRAHRYAFEREYGPLGDLYACHKCDNPSCVRPSHLFAGTNSDNMNDKVSKGRTLGFAAMKGEQHTQSKLTEKDIVEIKRRLINGIKQKEIALDFGIDSSVVSRIKTGKIWKNVSI